MENFSASKELLDESIHLEAYLPLVYSRVHAFRQSGIEQDDLFQEGIIGLLRAIRSYRPEVGASLETFAYTCITNRLRSAVLAAGRAAISVSFDEWHDQDAHHEEPTSTIDPQEIVANREELERWRKMVSQKLSSLEQRAVGLFLSGYSYEEIGASLQQSAKTIDNALQRAKRKLRE